MRSHFVLLLLAAGSMLMSGCEKYRPKPLADRQLVLSVDRLRRLETLPNSAATAAPPPFTFDRAVTLMRERSPALKELRAEYETTLAAARIRTPLPNPAVEAGPVFGFGPDVGSQHQLQPFGSLGFTFPTGRRLKRQDELNQAQADLSHMEMTIRGRELYLQLRAEFSQYVLTRKRVAARKKIFETAERSTQLSKRLVEAGQATALDVGLIEADQARVQTETFSSEAELTESIGDLSELIGVHAEYFENVADDALPELPAAPPALDSLRDMLVNNHPQLARLRARYEVAERELHLEIARQYPDFRFGPTFERETGERKNMLGLTLGIDLPIFDRNQQAVATAKKRRDEIAEKYEAAANRALAGLEKAWRNYQLAGQKLQLIKTVVLPKTTSNMELARRAVEAGGIDSLRVLETERGQRVVLLDALDSELSVRTAWIALEQAVGYPLLRFPSETEWTLPEKIESVPPLPPQEGPARGEGSIE